MIANRLIDTHPKHIAGFIDLVDILAFLINITNSGVNESNAGTLANAFLSKPVGDLMGNQEKFEVNNKQLKPHRLFYKGSLHCGTRRR